MPPMEMIMNVKSLKFAWELFMQTESSMLSLKSISDGYIGKSAFAPSPWAVVVYSMRLADD